MLTMRLDSLSSFDFFVISTFEMCSFSSMYVSDRLQAYMILNPVLNIRYLFYDTLFLLFLLTQL